MGDEPPVGIQRIDTATNRVIATIPVHQPYGATAAGYGSLWVHDYLNMQLVRIDLQTNEVVARIKMWIADPEGNVAAGEGGVWVLSDKDGVLSRVDPEKNEVVAEIAVNPGSFCVMTGFGSVWTTQTIGKTVQRIDPKTNQVVATIEVRLGPKFFAVGEGGVWVLSYMDGSVTRIDPNTNQVVAVIEHVTDGQWGDIAAGDGAVWVRGTTTLLTVIDPKTNQISKRYGPSQGSGAVRVRDGMVWVTAHDTKKIWRLDSGQ